MKTLRFVLPLFLLTLSAVCQTTTSYPVTGGSGTATTPTRISFSAMNGSQFFESGYGTSCGGQTTQALGFVLLNGGIFGSGVCASVTTQPVGSCGNLYAEFQGLDAAGIPFKGSLSLTTTCQYVRLRYSKTVYTVTGGTLTITE
jgi:hypothetical protein